MTGNLDSLHFRSSDTMEGPSGIQLSGDFLTWRVQHNRPEAKGIAVPVIGTYPTRNVLTEFVKLADARPEQVFEFVQKHGPLGVEPSVEMGWSSSSGKRYHICYQEHIFYYTVLARLARNIVRVMQALKDGKSVKKTAVAECLPEHLWFNPVGFYLDDPQTYKSAEAYYLLVNAIHHWWDVATLNIEIPYPDLSGASSAAPTPELRLSFGKWQDGAAWDQNSLSANTLCRSEGTASTGGPSEEDDEMPLQVALQVARHEKFEPGKGEWRYRASLLPKNSQRPSPLFNALTLQLLQAVTVPEGTYFCAQCGLMYQHDPSQGNKPRRDKKNSFHSPECRKEWDLTIDRKRKRERSAQEKSAAGNTGG